MASTAVPGLYPYSSGDADMILDEVCRYLQLTQTQYERAVSAYKAIGEWLAAPDSPLRPYRPIIFPQGSMALRTTTRPYFGGEEFDLDLVLLVALWSKDPIALHDALGRRLAAHGYYGTILERKNRCWRLNYAGQFHLDVMPARPDDHRPGNAVEVPDRELRGWRPSNPRDFVQWFETKVALHALLKASGDVEPMPAYNPGEQPEVLRRAVQLLKRRRDVRFVHDADDAPRSVVLTTLAAKHYTGAASISQALLGILAGMDAEIRSTPGILVVPNPTNVDENFAERWQGDIGAYRKFVMFVRDTATELQDMLALPLAGGFVDRASELFGERAVKHAVNQYGARTQGAREAGLLRYGAAAGITTLPHKTRPYREHNFFGSAE